MKTTVADVHYDISRFAADRANQLMHLDPRIPDRWINSWLPNGNRTLGIVFDQNMMSAGEEVVAAMQEIGNRAMHEALVEHGDLLVGAILGEARKGRNYFDRHHGRAND